MFTEERISEIKRGQKSEYIKFCRNNVWPSVRTGGGKVLCLLGGMIGKPNNILHQLTLYQNNEQWLLSQGAWTIDRDEYIVCEKVNLLNSIGSRPKNTIPPEDRRRIYAYRKFTISPNNLNEFIKCSEEGIWPRLENMGAIILGMWTNIASTNPMEITLLTGYHGPKHWEETRYEDILKHLQKGPLWNKENELRKRRSHLIESTYVNLMESVEF